MNDSMIPISTKWLLDASKAENKRAIDAVYLIYCEKTKMKGTGFLLKTGHIITNWHVVENCNAKEVLAISDRGTRIKFKELITDSSRDLAILAPEDVCVGGLELDTQTVETETKVMTWGHPLSYNGPSPILSMGYLAGFRDHQKDEKSSMVKRYIINGAFNPGNSGGPLFIAGDNKVVGIVVAKHAPIPPFLSMALDTLANNRNGIQYTATTEKGDQIPFSEGQIVAELLKHQRSMTQVMLGEAIVAEELKTFLKEHAISL